MVTMKRLSPRSLFLRQNGMITASSLVDGLSMRPHMGSMCGRVIQSSGPLRYGLLEGMDARDTRVHNYPPRWNAAPSQELLVIRRNHQTGQVSLDPLRWGLIPYWCQDPKGGRRPINAKCETVATLPTFRDAYRKRRCIASSNGRRSRDRRRSSLTRGAL